MLTYVWMILQALLIYLTLSMLFWAITRIVIYLFYLLVYKLDSWFTQWLHRRPYLTADKGIQLQMMRIHIRLDQLTDTLLTIHYRWMKRKLYFLRINVINALTALFAYHLASNLYAVMETFRDTALDITTLYHTVGDKFNALDASKKNYVKVALCAPLIWSGFEYGIFRIFHWSDRMIQHIRFLRRIEETIGSNITSLKRWRRDLIVQKLDELTASIGYTLENGELVSQDRAMLPSNIYEQKIDQTILIKISEVLSEFQKIPRQSQFDLAYLHRLQQKIEEFIQVKLSGGIFSLTEYEQLALDNSGLSERSQKCAEYFSKNRNQIYKHKFTKVRVIRQEVLQRLEYYEEMALQYTKQYEEHLNSYYFSLLENRCRIEFLFSRLRRELYPSYFIGDIINVLRYVISRYLRILAVLIV